MFTLKVALGSRALVLQGVCLAAYVMCLLLIPCQLLGKLSTFVLFMPCVLTILTLQFRVIVPSLPADSCDDWAFLSLGFTTRDIWLYHLIIIVLARCYNLTDGVKQCPDYWSSGCF